MAKPKKIVAALQCEIDSAVEMLLAESGLDENAIQSVKADWRVFITETVKGRTRYMDRTLTVPLWAYKRGVDYFLYYVSHELAHIFAGPTANHGPAFMRVFRAICPAEFQHYELGYKPRNAIAAGIRNPDGSAPKRKTRKRQTPLGLQRSRKMNYDPLSGLITIED